MIRILIVDDSAVIRQILSNELAKYNDIEVAGTAADAFIARQKIVKLQPHVLTLDIQMPRLDGLSFLQKIMKHYPLPVVVVSSFSPENSAMALKALELGAVDVIEKPGSHVKPVVFARDLARAIRTAAKARVFRQAGPSAEATVPTVDLDTQQKVLAIGASTGGTRAIEAVLTCLPANIPGTVIVQHMPQQFTGTFARRLNDICAMEVREARDGDFVQAGLVLIAPGNKHMVIQRAGARYQVRIKDGPPVHHQRPSVDVLFESVARNVGQNAAGVILTGMGADGAAGMRSMRDRGAYTIAQNQESCAVYGMPKEAVRMGAAARVLPLNDIAKAIVFHFRRQKELCSV